MIRSILLTAGVVLLVCVQLNVSAQSSIAKFKYEEAEEAFSKDDFKTCLSKLREAEEKLGSVNQKIMFLRIMAEHKLHLKIEESDLELITDLREHVDLYMKQYGGDEKIHDKVREVYKISESIKVFGNHSALLKTARKGNLNAMVAFAELNTTWGSFATALRWYKQAAEKGSAAAMTGIGILYEYGMLALRDYNQALYWYKQAADKNYDLALISLGCMYYYGNGVPKNKQRADELIRQAIPGLKKHAEKKDEPLASYALMFLGGLHDDGEYLEKDGNLALTYYEQAGEMRNTIAMYWAGDYYFRNSKLVKKDLEKGLNWFRRSAQNMYSRSMYRLAIAYYKGNGVEQNNDRALYWMKWAVNCHSLSAMIGLADFYYNGVGTAKDHTKALYWYQKAADAEVVRAMIMAGNMYRDAEGTERNLRKAIEYYEKAVAAKDSVEAYRLLGDLCYKYNGYGRDINYQSAMGYYKRAADKGDKHSMEMIGTMYMNGNGVKKDKKLGKEWIYKSSGNEGLMNLIKPATK